MDRGIFQIGPGGWPRSRSHRMDSSSFDDSLNPGDPTTKDDNHYLPPVIKFKRMRAGVRARTFLAACFLRR